MSPREDATPVVNSWNEWDPLEEVVVGIVENATLAISQYGQTLGLEYNLSRVDEHGNLSDDDRRLWAFSGRPLPLPILLEVMAQIDHFVDLLRKEGVTVRRPDPIDIGAPIVTPFWRGKNSDNQMNVRDLVLVVGDELIETPSPNRHRYFEAFGMRRLFKEYFARGARWSAAPRPVLSDATYHPQYPAQVLSLPRDEQDRHPFFATTEFEPVFDAADFVRCGRDIFCQRSSTTNRAGIEWLRRHLGSGFRLHEIETACRNAVHIDSTFVPLGPGKAMYNPTFVKKLPDILKKWDVFEAPEPARKELEVLGVRYQTSGWISINTFMLDEKRIFVEAAEEPLIRKLKDWGLEPIPVPYHMTPILGGAFHCSTLDIRRRGGLKSYF